MRGSRVFKTHPFSRWAKDVELTAEDLCCAVEEMRAGLVDADSVATNSEYDRQQSDGVGMSRRVEAPIRPSAGQTLTTSTRSPSARKSSGFRV